METNIGDIKKKHCLPFEIEDTKMRELFSFFLHKAPTIGSATALLITEEKLTKNWKMFIDKNTNINFKIFSASTEINEKNLKLYGGSIEDKVDRRDIFIICNRKGKESDHECVLRHVRNSIAHNNIYIIDRSKRKFILLEDYNLKGKLTSRMLLSQTVLNSLRIEIKR
jgi:hypothetical protein